MRNVFAPVRAKVSLLPPQCNCNWFRSYWVQGGANGTLRFNHGWECVMHISQATCAPMSLPIMRSRISEHKCIWNVRIIEGVIADLFHFWWHEEPQLFAIPFISNSHPSHHPGINSLCLRLRLARSHLVIDFVLAFSTRLQYAPEDIAWRHMLTCVEPVFP